MWKGSDEMPPTPPLPPPPQPQEHISCSQQRTWKTPGKGGIGWGIKWAVNPASWMWAVSSFVIRNKAEAALGPLITQIKQLPRSHTGKELLSREQCSNSSTSLLTGSTFSLVSFLLTLAAPSLGEAIPLIWL